MSSPLDPNEALERQIHATLRSLPPRRAPGTLETRVLAELERRAALPWWRRSFVHWPMLARAGFIVVSLVLMRFALVLGSWVMAGFEGTPFREAFAPQLAWYEKGVTVVHAIGGFFDIMHRNIPPVWLYGGLAFIAAMYATLLGLGAAAYKALHARR